MSDYKKLTSHHRRQFGDRKYQSNNSPLFKIPTIPLRIAKRRFIKNKLEMNHHNYNLSTARTVIKDYKSSVLITNKVKTSHTESKSKSVNRRKVRKINTVESLIRIDRLVHTPAWKMIYKRSRELDDQLSSATKRRKLDASQFNVEPDDKADNHSYCLKNLFGINTGNIRTVAKHVPEPVVDKAEKVPNWNVDNVLGVADAVINANTMDKKFPDQNENLVSYSHDLMECGQASKNQKIIPSKAELSSIDFKSKIQPEVSPKADGFTNGYKLPEMKLQTPLDVKFNLKCHVEIEDNCLSDPIDIVDVKPIVVVRTESKSENIESAYTYDTPLTTYAGQLLWAQYLSFSYWPAIVCETDTDTTKDTIQVKFFACKDNYGVVKKKNCFEFDGMDSFWQYKKEMESKLNKSEWKTAFNISRVSWKKAAAQGLYLLSKDVEQRLAFFDIILICSLPKSTKKYAKHLASLISTYTSPSQLEAVQKIFDANPNIIEDVQQKLAEISISPEARRKTLSPTLTKSTNEKTIGKRRHSECSNLLKRRTSVRLISTVPSQLSATASEPVSDVSTLSTDTEAEEKKKLVQQKRREDKRLEFEKALELYANTARQRNILFKGLPRGNVCKICLCADDKEMVQCAGSCGDHVHKKCTKNVPNTNISTTVRCHECCSIDGSPVNTCYSCKKPCTESVLRCSIKTCGRYYHPKCLDEWLQTKFIESDKVICPSHVCHTCVSDDPRNKHFTFHNSELTRCIKCPTTFHKDSNCIPAGVKILTNNQHICIRHRQEKRKLISLNWCYICGVTGGSLLCCETCPLTSHIECLHIPVADGHYVCDSCETGRHPLYGEIVWAKYSTHTWWPGVVVPPACIPDSVSTVKNEEQALCVRFFGDHSFGWVGRSFVFLYDEGDAQKSLTAKGNVKLNEAIQEAEHWYKIFTDIAKKARKFKPLPYTKIGKINVLPPARLIKKENESHPCTCSPNDIDPCGPTSNCANRACCTECDPNLCPCGDKCNNQCIEKKKYAKFRLQHMGDKGFGLIAEEFIYKGTLIVEYVGELVTEKEFQSRIMSKQTQNLYFMKYGRNLYIDAELKGNMSRFMNHSCNPNCEPRVINVKGFDRIGLFALHNIKQGTELTFNYEFDDGTHKCYCSEHNCRGIIGRKVGSKVA